MYSLILLKCSIKKEQYLTTLNNNHCYINFELNGYPLIIRCCHG